jgi:hypothetical protein
LVAAISKEVLDDLLQLVCLVLGDADTVFDHELNELLTVDQHDPIIDLLDVLLRL